MSGAWNASMAEWRAFDGGGPPPDYALVRVEGLLQGVRVFTDCRAQHDALMRTIYVNRRPWSPLDWRRLPTAREGVWCFELRGSEFLAVERSPADDVGPLVAACVHSRLHGTWRCRPLGIEETEF